MAKHCNDVSLIGISVAKVACTYSPKAGKALLILFRLEQFDDQPLS
jgi:hypothetical protein